MESMYMIGIAGYVIAANRSRREILPALVIILLAYAVRLPVSYLLYGREISLQVAYFGFYFLFNCLLSFILFTYHCNPKLQQMFSVEFQRKWIPQVVAICMILVMSAIFILCLVAELVTYWIIPEWFSQSHPPFFYSIHKYTSAAFTCLMLLGVWSMMLDAHYLKARLDHKKNSLHF
jgi:hypothetical protein